MTRPIRQGHNSSWKGTPKVVLAFGLLMILLTAAMPAVAEGEKKDDTGTNPVNFTNDFRFITEMQQFPDSGGFKRLNCMVKLQRAPLHQYSIEAEGTNSGGDLGMGGNITYRNRNIFRNGETFQFKVRGALEAQRASNTDTENEKTFLFFNTYEWGVEARINFPRFLIPVKPGRPSPVFLTPGKCFSVHHTHPASNEHVPT